jgi:hypothetical protein
LLRASRIEVFTSAIDRRKKNTVAIEYLDKAIMLVKTQLDFAQHGLLFPLQVAQGKALPKLKWTGSQMELVEVVYALHEAKCFGETPLKKTFAIVGELFDCEIKNHCRLFWDIRNRVKGERVKFLDKIRKLLIEKLIRMDK